MHMHMRGSFHKKYISPFRNHDYETAYAKIK